MKNEYIKSRKSPFYQIFNNDNYKTLNHECLEAFKNWKFEFLNKKGTEELIGELSKEFQKK
jgi:hypothetical protein